MPVAPAVGCPHWRVVLLVGVREETVQKDRHNANRTTGRASRGRVRKAWAVPVVLIALCAAVGSLRDGGWKSAPMRQAAGNGAGSVEKAGEKQAKPRLVYPFSVVPGGIENGAEVAQALARDPVVEAHYDGFRADRARVVLLTEPRLVHVSYRVKDKVYWTRKKVKLRKGEKLITDGKELIRARCGNRISDAPMAPMALVEPPEVSSDTPLLPLPLVALARPIEAPAGAPAPSEEKEAGAQPAPFLTPVAPAGRTGIVPIVFPFGGGGGGVPPGGSPPPTSGSPAGTPAAGGTPPGTPSVAPPAPVAAPPAQPPAAPPPTTPGNPPTAPPTNPPSTPSTEPPATPPGTPVVPPGTQPSPPAPGTPSVTPPGSVPPGVAPPDGTPTGPADPPLPGFPPTPNGVTPPGPGPIPPPDVIPPPGVPGPQPEPPPVTLVPEPSTYVLIGCGLAALALLKRRNNRA